MACDRSPNEYYTFKLTMNFNMHSRLARNWPQYGSFIFLLLCFAGCDRGGVQVYRVPKELASTQMSAQSSMPSGHPDIGGSAQQSQQSPQLTWKTPEGWTESPPGEMRVASFKISGKDGRQADLSIVPLSGGGGGDIANVNRWRGQVGLPPLSPEEIKKS